MSRFVQLPIPGNNTRDYWQVPSGKYEAYGVPFVLGSGPTAVWTSQADDVPNNPTLLPLPVDKRGISQVHLLYNGGDTYTRYLGNHVVDIKLEFGDGWVQSVSLVVGRDCAILAAALESSARSPIH